jgi:hypothetical protein
MDWIRQAQDTKWWLALMNAVVTTQVPYKADDFLTSLKYCCLIKKEFSSMVLINEFVRYCYVTDRNGREI